MSTPEQSKVTKMSTHSKINPCSCKMFFQMGVDLIGPLKQSNGKQYIISCVDYFSKYVEAKGIENKTDSEVTKFL